jgi:hypothetical protein
MAHHTDHLTVKRQFKAVSQIDPTPVPTVFSINISSQMVKSFSNEKN